VSINKYTSLGEVLFYKQSGSQKRDKRAVGGGGVKLPPLSHKHPPHPPLYLSNA